MPPLALYVHLPWCVRKCPYCDFNSHHAPAAPPYQAYTDVLLRDLAEEQATLGAADRVIESIFFGGGTPSLFPAREIERIIEGARAIGLSDDCEITLEANPGTLERGRFADLRAAGVTRLSIGVQSFGDTYLKALGRIHNEAQAATAIDEAFAAGFDRLNIDLMYGLPGQDAADAARDVERALALGASHISHYELTIEPNTVFHRAPPVLPQDEAMAAIRDAAFERLRGAGLTQYEVSAWARDGHRCRHNLNYWRYGDYLGVGAGAHAKLTGRDGQIRRDARLRSPALYQRAPDRGARLASSHAVADGDRLFEFMLGALRLREGFEIALFSERTGLAAEVALAPLRAAASDGLIERSGTRWRPSERGWRFLNDLQARFLPEDSQQPSNR